MTRALLRISGIGLSFLVGISSALAVQVNVTYSYDNLGRLTSANYGPTGGLTYVYDRAGNITQINSTLVAAMPTIPATPAKPAAGDGDSTTSVQLDWSMESATTYQLFRCQDATTTNCGTAISRLAGSPFADLESLPGMLYYYRLKACNASGCSSFSAADAGWRNFDVPNALTATGNLAKQIRVDWAAPGNVGGALPAYKLFRADSENGSKALLTTTAQAGASSYLDTTATNGSRYWYWVQACATDGERCGGLSSGVNGMAVAPLGGLKAARNFEALLVDVNGTYPGKELILPVAQDIDGGIRFGFNIYSPDTATTRNGKFRYATNTRDLIKPNCPAGVTVEDESENWIFLSNEKYLIAGVRYKLDCAYGGPQDKSFVYIVDASRANKAPTLLSYPDKLLLGLNLTGDHNQAGSGLDLMISLKNDVAGTVRFDLRDFVTGGYSSNTIKSMSNSSDAFRPSAVYLKKDSQYLYIKYEFATLATVSNYLAANMNSGPTLNVLGAEIRFWSTNGIRSAFDVTRNGFTDQFAVTTAGNTLEGKVSLAALAAAGVVVPDTLQIGQFNFYFYLGNEDGAANLDFSPINLTSVFQRLAPL